MKTWKTHTDVKKQTASPNHLNHLNHLSRQNRPTAQKYIAAFFVMATLFLFITAGAGCGTGSGQEDAVTEIENTAVEIERVKTGDLKEYVEISGTIDSDGNVTLVPQINGTVARIAVSVGDRVQSGQVLVELDNEDVATQVRQAESRLQQVRLQLDTAREVQMPRQIDRMESELEQLAERLSQAESQLETTKNLGMEKLQEQFDSQINELEIYYNEVKRSYERAQQLFKEDIIPRADYERAETEYKSAGSRLESAREQKRLQEESLENDIEQLESQVRQLRTQYDAASRQLEMEKVSHQRETAMIEAQLRDAEIGLDAAQLALDKTRLKAPVSGTVSSVMTRIGQELNPGIPVATLVDYDALYVKAQITERQLELASEGDTVVIQVPTLDQEYPGTVREIALAPQEGTRSYPVKAYFDTPAEQVRIGQHANLLFVTQEARETLVIPRRAVIEENGAYHAFVVENGVAKKRLLELGLTREDAVEVLSGLAENEQIIIRGQHFVEDGDPVDIVGGEVS